MDYIQEWRNGIKRVLTKENTFAKYWETECEKDIGEVTQKVGFRLAFSIPSYEDDSLSVEVFKKTCSPEKDTPTCIYDYKVDICIGGSIDEIFIENLENLLEFLKGLKPLLEIIHLRTSASGRRYDE
jgi:hypothetical protein